MAGVRGPHAPYMDGLGRLPGKVMVFPGFVFGRFGDVDPRAIQNASPAVGRRAWPVHAAFLEFLAAPARARIVPPDARPFVHDGFELFRRDVKFADFLVEQSRAILLFVMVPGIARVTRPAVTW